MNTSKPSKIYRYLSAVMCTLGLLLTSSRGADCCSQTRSVVKSSIETEGVKIQMLCDFSNVVSGQEVTIGFFVQHKPGFHSYWKQPGKVGYPLHLEWKSPSFKKAPEMDWDLPERVSMNGHPAHGYKRDVIHLSRLKVPDLLVGDVWVVKVEAAWLACSKTCFPSTGYFELSLPVVEESTASANSKKFHRKSPPKLEGWTISAVLEGGKYNLTLTPENSETIRAEELYCYSEDGQTTSSFSQDVRYKKDGSILFSIEPAAFGSETSKKFPCLLYSKSGWGSSAVKYVRINPSLGTPKAPKNNKNYENK